MYRFVARTTITVVVAAGCFWIPIARGQYHPTYEASIPFPFYASDALLPAGTYQITELSQQMLLLRNAGGVVAYELVFPRQLDRRATTGQLTFSKYGSRYFLREFSAPNGHSGLHMASTFSRGGIERRAAKEFADASRAEMAVNAVPRALDSH